MEACYAPDVRFWDPVFQELRGRKAGAMWRMLTKRSDDLEVELVERTGTETSGSARWLATYTFTQTGRPVVNDVRATFSFDGGLIVDHRDEFSFYRWARQALGPVGVLLGWTPAVQGAVRKRAQGSLAEFVASEESAG